MRSNECYYIEREIVTEFLDQDKDIPEGSIVNYLTKCFPDSCFAYNYTNCKSAFYEDINRELYEYFRFEVLKWCGCGAPEEADKQVAKYLNMIDNSEIPYVDFIENSEGWCKSIDDKRKRRKELCKKYFGCESIYDNPLLLCLAYSIDASEFSEHGTSIGGAWITDRGKIYRYAIMKHLEAEGESLDED